MGKNKIYHLKQFGILCIIFLFASSHSLLGQDRWIKVSNPNQKLPLFDVLGENYYMMPSKLLVRKGNNEKSLKKEIILPNENGEDEVFEIVPVPLLSKTLSEKHQNIKTYTGVSKTRPKVHLRLSTQPNGINAWIQFDDGSDYFIQPVNGKQQLHFTYTKTKTYFTSPLFCKTKKAILLKQSKLKTKTKKIFSGELRKFRIAISATGEYTSFWGDNDDSNGSNAEDAFASVVSTLNRINVIFERDLNIRLELVSDSNLLYEDPNIDPFTGNFKTELQATLDDIIGDSAYDVGHLFDYGEPDGDAGCIGCVCISGEKGKGFATHPFRDIFGGEFRNDYFDIDYAGHEIGHQFGAYHTYSFETEGTGFNVEPGSGSTIMGYAGITGVDNVQEHGSPYFHYYSIENILEYLETTSCGTSESISLDSFSIDAGKDYLIPIGTPYELIIDSLVAQQGENYTYCWEQLDSAQITSANFGPNNPVGAMARSLPPDTKPLRIIPNLDRVLINKLTEENPGINSDWETVPLVGRSLIWGLSVRKQTPSYSHIAQDEIKITAVASSGPFTVNSQNEPETILKGGALENIIWSVAQTDQNPIRANEVTISLSTDGGSSFPIILANGVPNNGFAQIIIPNNINTSSARIKIKPTNSIFFAINSEEFSIESRDLVLNLESFIKENCGENTQRFLFDIDKAAGFEDSFSLKINSLPTNLTADFSKSSYPRTDTSGYFEISGLSSLDYGDYNFTLEASYNGKSEVFPFILKQRNEVFEPANLLEPYNSSQEVSLSPILKWETNSNIDQTRIQLSKDQIFETLVLDTIISKNKLQLDDLLSSNEYYWRIQTRNNCGSSDFSEIFSFETNSITCTEINTNELPKDILDATDNEKGTTLATINVNIDAPILDINVLVDLIHTWTEDLSLYLETPDGSRYLLSSAAGGSGDNYTQTIFDQEASLGILDGTPPFKGSFIPIQDLSVLYGTSSRGLWKLVVLDEFKEDTGRLFEFELNFCLEGTLTTNSDSDSISDEKDNCPLVTNENQADVDDNGIGDLCDLFSTQNLTLTKKDTSCPNNQNGSLSFNARADYLYRAEIIGPDGFQENLNFTVLGKKINDLGPGIYSICIYTNSFPEFEYCYETQINSPDYLSVQTSYNSSLKILNLNLSGSDKYNITLNNKTYLVTNKNSVQFPLTQKTNRLIIQTNIPCQGVFEQWINLEQNAKVFPNPVIDSSNLILPKDKKADIYLLSGTGELYWSKRGVSETEGTIIIPMESLPRGWYILNIDYGNNLETHKLLKK